MGESNKEDLKEIIKSIKDAEEKIDKLASVLEKFGLDIITKMGQTNVQINMLTDKVDDVSKATIDVKALLPQLTNVIENQKILEAELDLIRTLIQRADISLHTKEAESETIKRDTTATDKKQAIINEFNLLVEELDDVVDPSHAAEILENIKEDIFVFTGGHRILYEIGQYSKRLNGLNAIPEDLKNDLKEKIVFWINKLSVKG
ncbi:MAG: hypothetical protein ACW986_12940 [Promethearchaeota archaeon]|jgi:chromosome segregation ATPase